MLDPATIIAFLLGCGLTFAVVHQLGRSKESTGDPRATLPVRPEPIPLRETPPEFKEVANGLGSELADVATGIDGHAQLLCESIGNPARIATHAQRLWSSVRKLRLCSQKVLASSGPIEVEGGPVDVGELLQRLRQHLEDYSDAGLQVKCEAASSLPRAQADGEVLWQAIQILIETLLDLETDAGVLVLHASTRVTDDLAPSVAIQIRVESEGAPDATDPRRRSELGRTAARNLIESLDGQLLVEHCPGLCSTAVIHLPAATPAAPDGIPALPPRSLPADPTTSGPATPPGAGPHPFGGILIVEDDPGVRTAVAREMEKTGRRVFTCADGAAARSLFTATPERFELLILDSEARRQPGARLAAEALTRSPELKVLLLGKPSAEQRVPGPPERYRELRKPFGITELRDVVGDMLGTPSAPRP